LAPEAKRSLSVRINAVRRRLDHILDSVWLYGASLFSKLLAPFKKINDSIPPQDSTNEKHSSAAIVTASPSKDERTHSIPAESNLPPAPTDKKKSPKRCRKRLEIARFVVEILGLIGLLFYVALTYEMWQVAQDTLRLSQRAYVTVGKQDGVVADFVIPKDPNQNAEIIIYFQNTGRLPAKFAWGTTIPLLAAGGQKKSTGINYVHPYKGLPTRTRNKKDGSIGEQGESTIVAGESVYISTLGTISQKDLAELPANNMGLLILGEFAYCDELGTYSPHRFALRYRSNAPSTNLSFDLAEDSPGFHLMLPEATAATEYLPPCETPAERERWEKK
jgi:hypothetical protein